MDPNETLRLLRLTIKQMRVDINPLVRKAHADEIAEYAEALDEWLSKGGFLPDAWNHHTDAFMRVIDDRPPATDHPGSWPDSPWAH